MKTTFSFTRCAGLLAAALVLIGLGARAEERVHPNIVFVFADEHRYQSMGHTEMPRMKTPTMDRMAAQGFSSSSA